MIERFRGPDGARILGEALKQQASLLCSDTIVADIIEVAEPEAFLVGAHLMIQGSDDNRIAFILSGRVTIRVNGHLVAERSAGQHVGEMAVIDPSARRSATVTATEETCVAWVSERDFTALALKHPELWRAVARELGSRLRQRGAQIRMPNERPVVFIGSSSEARTVATSISRFLARDPVVARVWHQGVFGASKVAIESLEEMSRAADFAVLILSADDTTKTRGRRVAAPRDNVVFELGLFVGAIERIRTLLLVEEKKGLRIPPDLYGVTYLPFSRSTAAERRRTIAKAADEVRTRIAELGPKQ
jgi:CRP/FNR family transcriptional regulator, cyclic AMP receptor protein